MLHSTQNGKWGAEFNFASETASKGDCASSTGFNSSITAKRMTT